MPPLSNILLKGFVAVLVIALLLLIVSPNVFATCWVYPNNCSCVGASGGGHDNWQQGSPNWLYNTSSLYFNETYLNLTIEGLDDVGGNPFDQSLNTTDDPTFGDVSATKGLDVNGQVDLYGYVNVHDSPDDYSLFITPTGSGKRNSPYMGLRGDGGSGLIEMLFHMVPQSMSEYYLEVTDSSGNPSMSWDDDGQVNVSWGELVVGPEPQGYILNVDGRSHSNSPVRIYSSTAGNTFTTTAANVFNAGGVNTFRATGSNTFQNSLAGGLYNYIGFGYWNHTSYFGIYALRIYPNWRIFQWNLNQNMNGADVGSFIINGSEVNITSHSTFIIDHNVSGRACNTNNEGGIYYDGTTKKHYGCNSTDWNALY